MADTYTTNGKVRKIEQGAYPDAWAPRINDDALELLDDMIAGTEVINLGVSTNYSLPALANGTDSISRAMTLLFIGTPASPVTVTVPESVISKLYLVKNDCGQPLTIKYAATSGVTIANDERGFVYANGTTVYTVTTITSNLIADTMQSLQLTDAESDSGIDVNKIFNPWHVERYGIMGDGTDESEKIQAAFDMIVGYGGRLIFDGTKTYRCDSALTLQNSAAGHKELSKIIFGNGATFDFSSSGITSGALITVGATSLPYISENQVTEIRDIEIIGPESAAVVRTAPATTVVGLSFVYAIGWRAHNCRVQYCYKGFQSFYWWDGIWDSGQVRNCYIGFHIDSACTRTVWLNMQTVQNTYGVLIQPTSGVVVNCQTFEGTRIESCDIGVVSDPQSDNIRGLVFIDPRFEAVEGDLFRSGIVFDPVYANRNTRTDRAGFVTGFQVIGGENSDNFNYGSTHKPFVFSAWSPTTKGVKGVIIKGFPCGFSDIDGMPNGLDFTPGVGGFGSSTPHWQSQEMDSVVAGEARVTFAGSSGTNDVVGNAGTFARNSTGNYTLVPRIAYAAVNRIVVSGGGDGCNVELDSANSTTTSLRILCKDYAGSLIDPTRAGVTVKGPLKAWT